MCWKCPNPWFSIAIYHDTYRQMVSGINCKDPWYKCHCEVAIKAREKEMTPDTEEIIKNYPGISMKEARLIFIRNAGRDEFKARSANPFDMINIPAPIKDATRESVINYIGFLDTMIKELKAYQQGLEIEYAKEVEPEIESNHREREAEKDSKRSAPVTREGAIKKALMGMDKEALIAALKKQIEENKAKGNS